MAELTTAMVTEAIRSQCDGLESTADGCYSVIGPINMSELTKSLNYLLKRQGDKWWER